MSWFMAEHLSTKNVTMSLKFGLVSKVRSWR